MSVQTLKRVSLPVIAGLAAVIFASLPTTRGREVDSGGVSRDRVTSDPQVQGYRRDAKIRDEVRQAVAEEEGISETGRKIRIYAANGNVILKGRVESLEEKAKIEEVVRRVAKNSLVANDLKVKTEKK